MSHALVEFFDDYWSSIPDKSNRTVLDRLGDFLKLKGKFISRFDVYYGLSPTKSVRRRVFQIVDETDQRQFETFPYKVKHVDHDFFGPVQVWYKDKENNKNEILVEVDPGQVIDIYLGEKPPETDRFSSRYTQPFIRVTHLPYSRTRLPR